jgi:putative DNA primase/helicase
MTALDNFKNWSQEQRNEYFAKEAAAYRARKAAESNTQFLATESPVEERKPAAGVQLHRGDKIQPEAYDWLWPGYLARSKLHIMAGAPGCGKTTLALRIAAIVSSGATWPDGMDSPAGNILIWSGEDGIADTLVPRLAVAGADLSRCHFVGDVLEGNGSRPFDPSRDFDRLIEKVAAIGGAELLICDPIVTAVKGDSHKNAEVRRGLQPLFELAVKSRCAVLGISHFSKGTAGRDPVERVTGSIAFGALPRAVFAVTRQAASQDGQLSDRRLFVRAKTNIGEDGDGFAFVVVERQLDGFPNIKPAVAEFTDPLFGEAKTLLTNAEAANSGTGRPMEEAKDFLFALLAAGPVSANEANRKAAEAGIAVRTLTRARKAIAVGSRKSAMDGGWEWHLPEDGHN